MAVLKNTWVTGDDFGAADANAVATQVNANTTAIAAAPAAAASAAASASKSADTIVDGTTNHVFTAADDAKLGGISTGATVTNATTVDAAGAVMNSDTSTATMDFVVDEDTMTSNSATKVPTQQSVKAYVDAHAGGGGGGTGDVTGPGSSVDGEVALFSGTGGKTVKRATGSGLAKLTSGVLGTATAGTDYYNPGGTDVPITDGGTGVSTLPSGLLRGAGTGSITAVSSLAGLNTVITDADLPPVASPTFTGTVTAPVVKITTGAAANKYLKSDASGNGSWEAPAGLDTVGIGRAVFIENGGTIPVGTPEYTIVIELDA